MWVFRMNLLIDLGNSRLKWAVQDPESWQTGVLDHWHDVERELDRAWGSITPSRVVMSSVADGEMTGRVQRWILQRWSLTPASVVAVPEQLGVRNGYEHPSQLGSDRWAALVAARALFQGRLCIVDCGTAVTIDALSEAGEFMGGTILPGLATMRRSLAASTSLVPSPGRDRNCLARSTDDGVAAGTRFALAGAVDRLLEEYEHVLGVPMPVILTGGDAETLRADLHYPAQLAPDLVLRGIALIATVLP
jgi:type III pantothenate kinase